MPMYAFALIVSVLGAPSDSDEKQLRYLKETLWPQAYRESDVALLSNILADDFVLIDNNGQWTDRATELAALPDYQWQHDQFDYTIRALRVYDGKYAIIAGEGKASGQTDGEAYCYRYQSSNILRKQQGRWRAHLSHVSGYTERC